MIHLNGLAWASILAAVILLIVGGRQLALKAPAGWFQGFVAAAFIPLFLGIGAELLDRQKINQVSTLSSEKIKPEELAAGYAEARMQTWVGALATLPCLVLGLYGASRRPN